jgi:hypothetical protein
MGHGNFPAVGVVEFLSKSYGKKADLGTRMSGISGHGGRRRIFQDLCGSEVEPDLIHNGSFTSGGRCPLPCMTPLEPFACLTVESGITLPCL